MPGKRHFEKSGLGKSLVNSAKGRGKNAPASNRHSTEMNDGADYNRIDLKSVTERNSLDEFLTIAEMANQDYNQDHKNITLITSSIKRGVLSEDDKEKIKKAHEENKGMITIPKRPQFAKNLNDLTRDELNVMENEEFLLWRRNLAQFQEKTGLILTPYERNIEVWRQLWRVVEKSRIVVQVLDARNPLLFLNQDLQDYVLKVFINSPKTNVVLLNKADLLTYEQRKKWAHYFQELGIRAIFFSALQEANRKSPSSSSCSSDDDGNDADDDDGSSSSEKSHKSGSDSIKDSQTKSSSPNLEPTKDLSDQNESQKEEAKNAPIIESEQVPNKSSGDIDDPLRQKSAKCINSPELLCREDLIDHFRIISSDLSSEVPDILNVGFVGYPNVGKSSTINALLQCKKTSISSTPGKTKHFQTFLVDKDLCIVDCPGLVLPNFVSSKAEMILNGVLPIDQMTDHVPAINLLTSLIPAHVFEAKYSIVLPIESIDSNESSLTAEQLLNAYGYMRGFMTPRGLPDNARSARYILKDFVDGKILFCVAPPTVEQSEYHIFSETIRPRPGHIPSRQKNLMKTEALSAQEFNEKYFQQNSYAAYSKGVHGVAGYTRKSDYVHHSTNLTDSSLEMSKPWRAQSKRNKKQKLRKVFAHLDIK